MGLHSSQSSYDAGQMCTIREGGVRVLNQERCPFGKDYPSLKELLVKINEVLPFLFFSHSHVPERSLIDGGPSPRCRTPKRLAGPPLGEASGSALRLTIHKKH